METTMVDINKLSIEKDNSSLLVAFSDVSKKSERISKPLMGSILRHDFVTFTEPNYGFNETNHMKIE